MRKKKVIVIGAGPAGMMASCIAASGGARVVLIEKKDRVGRKLSITGNGRCNITAAVDQADLVRGFPGNGRFLHNAFSVLSNKDLVDFFHSRGLPTRVEGSRVFPASDSAGDVVEVLLESAVYAGVEVLTSTRVMDIVIDSNRVEGIISDRGVMDADAVVVATGGMSYPGTGSTGDGYRWAAMAGHCIVGPRASLVPLLTAEKWVRDLQGVSLKGVEAVSLSRGNKVINRSCGELIFTHYGLSGPMILSMSKDISDHLHRDRQATIKLDLFPGFSEEIFDLRLQATLSHNSRKLLKNALNDLLTPGIIPVALYLCGINPEKECSQVARNERLSLVRLLKRFTLTIIGTRPIAEAVVTAGGVNVKEVSPKTMQSKLVNGLYFAGEVLDVDGYTGGYNLQAAFSTGFVAGRHAAKGNNEQHCQKCTHEKERS